MARARAEVEHAALLAGGKGEDVAEGADGGIADESAQELV